MSEIDERPVLTAEGVLHHAHRPVLVVSGE
jgi:hypothetical protein